MKCPKLFLVQSCLLIFLYTTSFSNNTNAGFFLPDSLQEMKLPFKTVDQLIIIPVTLNDSVKLNLILDTGCRNIVLFGRRFLNMLDFNTGREIVFSGLGTGASVKGFLSINNKVSIQSVLGKLVPIVAVGDKNLFKQYRNIDGVIGYDIFLKFEIEINSKAKVITFRKANSATPPNGYSLVRLNVIDSRPIMQSTITFSNKQTTNCDLMLDTGSSIGLLLKTTDIGHFKMGDQTEIIGRGLNGTLYGVMTAARLLTVGDFNFHNVNVGIIPSDWHNYASIGMEILKDYIVVLNYCKSYACFKKLT
jgi:hypothetical protein